MVVPLTIITREAHTAPSDSDQSVDPAANPWDMPGHSAGESFATWSIFLCVFGVILTAMLVDFYRKQKGQEMVTKRVLRRLWNFTFGRIQRLRIEEPDQDVDMEKAKGKGKSGSDTSSEEESPVQTARNPEITVTQPMAKIDSATAFNRQAYASTSLTPNRISEERSWPNRGHMLGPSLPRTSAEEDEDTRRHSYSSTHTQHSMERRVAQPLPGRMLTDCQI